VSDTSVKEYDKPMNETPKIKPAGKFGCLLLVIGLAFGAYRLFGDKLIPPKVNPNSPPVTSTDVCKNGKEVRMLVWAWNAQMGMMNANGAPNSTSNSLMCGQGVNLKLQRQDDSTQMQSALMAFAQSLKQGNENPTEGTHFVAIMGDGSAVFLSNVNRNLATLGSEYRAKVIGSIGYSRGEDKFMGPQQWKYNPQTAMGGVVAGVLRDGDWNIAQKWLFDNGGLKNNHDESTYDPEALNWVGTDSYTDAANKYVTGYSEERTVVRNGKLTNEKYKATVQGVVTWTPGDVTVAREKGGLVSIVSTSKYSEQMPCVIIGIDKWMKQNPEKVQGMLQAIFEGGDKVQHSDVELKKAAQVSEDVYQEAKTGVDYWIKYYKGVTEKDKTGNDVELGGSLANSIEDGAKTFGLLAGTANTFDATYKTFGDIVQKEYPTFLKSADYRPANEITDLSYMKALVAKMPKKTTESTPTPAPAPKLPPGPDVSKRNWNIQFETGRASFTQATKKVLEDLHSTLVIAQNTTIEIQGHTDNVGNSDKNLLLSKARAVAVKQWLQKKSSANFPESRFEVTAFGQDKPLSDRVDNNSEVNRAKNRRVTIIQKSTGR
jgi:OmpA-OmpF porin, OOP family